MRLPPPPRPRRAASALPWGSSVAATLALVAVSAGLYMLSESNMMSPGAVFVATLVTIPLATFLTIAVEWKAMNPVRHGARPAPEEIIQQIRRDAERINGTRAPLFHPAANEND